MGIIGDVWDKITGKSELKERPMTTQEKGEQNLQAAATREANRIYIPGQKKAEERDQTAQARESAGRQATVLQQARPAEKMVSYKDLFTEPTRLELKQERGVQREARQEIAAGKREPVKSYNELHPPESKGPGR